MCQRKVIRVKYQKKIFFAERQNYKVIDRQTFFWQPDGYRGLVLICLEK